MQQMPFEEWKQNVMKLMAPQFVGTDVGDSDPMDEVEMYFDATGDEVWRDMYDEGMSPQDAIDEEHYCAME